LPDEEKAIVRRLIDELERVSERLAGLDKVIAREALEDPRAVPLFV
jgi:transposase